MSEHICDIDALAEDAARAAALLDRPILLGIDGPGASGKSTLAALLAERLDAAVVIHVDDFHLPSADRPRTAGAIAADVDLARLETQVLRPAATGGTVRYRRYDWDLDRLAEWTELPPDTTLIVEGVHALHLRLRHVYTYRVFCDARREVRLSRGLARDGESARRLWEDDWMPAEDRYLATHRPHLRADVVLNSSVHTKGVGAPAYAVVAH
ncbi:uridine kinase family protein [Streptomyces sp. H27-H5]|uniref:uridine kinase family protein n=1 Tax=Streptomyces sp. H27-H5 TaxID=2996460 RepID=UPI002271995E|nr:uridine kinase [Streptomyces sp. H27-H5]MCY0958062.1 uridine kinase [Streptomyces sp. H27-H5]